MATQQERVEQDLQKYSHQLKQFSADYHGDSKLRARIDNNDVAPVAEALGMEIPQDVEVRVFVNTADTFYLTLPLDPGAALQDEGLMSISGGVGTDGPGASTAGSLGSLGTIPSCASSASTVGSVSTVK